MPRDDDAIAGLPPIAANADDLEAIKKTVEDAASVGGGLWISYLFVLFYMAVAAGAVTHTDLFMENPVKLPFLNIELPIKAFFFLAPILFCVMHVYTLTYFVILSNKARWYHDELNRQIAEDVQNPECAQSQRARAVRERLRRQLPSNIFVQFLAGPDEIRHSAFGFLLKTVAWTSLVIGPVLLLLLMQIQFLPYHSALITWVTRLILLADMATVWWLWHIILLGQGEFKQARRATSHIGTVAGALLSAAAIAFSWMIATFPGEPIETALGYWKPLHDTDDNNKIIAVSIHDWLFKHHINPTTRRRGIALSSTLVLPAMNIFEQLKIDKPDGLDIHRLVFRARGRDLRGAVFDLSILSNVDFEGADLRDASLAHAKLRNASLYCAHLQRASLWRADIQGSTFYAARMQGAELRFVLAQGAVLDGAQLQGATLGSADFEGASFKSADLDAASLEKTHLEGTAFDRTIVQAECFGADQRAAEIHHGASLQAANLTDAHLQGASLQGAQLQGVTLKNTQLEGVDLSRAFLWRAHFTGQDKSSEILRMKDPIWAPRQGDASGKAWSEADYDALAAAIAPIVPADDPPDRPMARLKTLDCADAKRIPCDLTPGSEPTVPPEGQAMVARASGTGYVASVTGTMIGLVCSGAADSLPILRGLITNGRLASVASNGTSILDTIAKDECLVSKSLSDEDKVDLLSMKKRLAFKGIPP